MKNFKKIKIFAIALLLIGAVVIISCEKEQLTLQDEMALTEDQPKDSRKKIKCQTIKSKESGVKTLTFMKCATQAQPPSIATLTPDFLVKELARQNGVTCDGREGCSKKKTCALSHKGNVVVAPGATLSCVGMPSADCEEGELMYTCTVDVAVNITLSCKCIKKPK